MVRVRVFKVVLASTATISSEDVRVEHVLEMPFVPPVGMTLYEGDWEAKILSVAWDGDNQEVVAYTTDEDEIPYAIKNGVAHRTVEEIVEELVSECGWHRRGR